MQGGIEPVSPLRRSWADMVAEQDQIESEGDEEHSVGAEHTSNDIVDNSSNMEHNSDDMEGRTPQLIHEEPAMTPGPQQNDQCSRVSETPQCSWVRETHQNDSQGTVRANEVDKDGFQLSKLQKKRLEEKERKARRALEAAKTPPNTRSRGKNTRNS